MTLSRHTIASCNYDAQVDLKNWTRTLERMGGLVYLEVPFLQKEDAKARGARWDRTKKKWYADTASALMDCWHWVPVEKP